MGKNGSKEEFLNFISKEEKTKQNATIHFKFRLPTLNIPTVTVSALPL